VRVCSASSSVANGLAPAAGAPRGGPRAAGGGRPPGGAPPPPPPPAPPHSPGARGAPLRSRTSRPKGRTKEQLYNEAKRMNIPGRSKMNKQQLQRAVDRRK
jgi:hypothetical protein